MDKNPKQDKSMQKLASRNHLIALSIFLFTMSLASGGCIPQIPHQPNERLVEELGVQEAQRRLKITVSHALKPQIVDVTVTDDKLEYLYQQGRATRSKQVFFANAPRIEIYTNNFVFVRTSTNQLIDQILFGNAEDAQLFADLMYSLRDNYLQHRFEKPDQVSAKTEAKPKQAPSIYDAFLDAVVIVKSSEALGTGFFVSNSGYLVTNQHVVGNDNAVSITLRDGRALIAKVITSARERDLALLLAKGGKFSWLTLGKLEDASIGTEVVAVGTPEFEWLSWSVTKGIISAVRSTQTGISLIQTDAPINKGNSGGPLISLETGVVVGINTLSFRKDIAEGLSFAVAADEITKAFGKYLKQ